MIFSREQQFMFLEDELQAEVKDFDEKLHTSATFLMEKGEVFTAQFLSFSDSGEMRVRFSASRPIPRKREYLYCMTLHKELRNYKNWGNRTYGDLIKDKTNQSEAVCNWTMPSDDPRFILAGFIGIDKDFADWIKQAPKVVLVLGPQRPPYEYLAHLQSLIRNNTSKSLAEVLDKDYIDNKWNPVLLNKEKNTVEFLQQQLQLSDIIVLQGPPGTGKTTCMADFCFNLCNKGFSVLVTALTNRALMEVAKKDVIYTLLMQGRVSKTKVTVDEQNELPLLLTEKVVSPKKGSMILSTFYITSGVADECFSDGIFDYVIVDEASQALLPMLGAARMLGKKTLFVGDFKQLAPVVKVNSTRIRQHNYLGLIDGLKTFVYNSSYPIYQLTDTFRLTSRGALFTGKFYGNTLNSRSRYMTIPTFNAFFLNPKGGPSLIKTDMELDDLKDKAALKIVLEIVSCIHKYDKSCKIAVLTCMRETVRALQKMMNIYLRSSKILIDTVARVQGITTDVCIYVVPNSLYMRSLEPRLFNVATSRAALHTVIVADKGIMGYSRMNIEVRDYLSNLDRDFSFYLPLLSDKKILDYNNKILQ